MPPGPRNGVPTTTRSSPVADFVTILFVALTGYACSSSKQQAEPRGDTSSPTSVEESVVSLSDCDTRKPLGKFLMAFNTCLSQGCPPSTHTIHLAYSDDGLRWSLVEDFGLDHAGSVPDIVFFDGFLYLFHTRSGGNHSWDRLNSCFEILEQGDVLVTGGDRVTKDGSIPL